MDLLLRAKKSGISAIQAGIAVQDANERSRKLGKLRKRRTPEMPALMKSFSFMT